MSITAFDQFTAAATAAFGLGFLALAMAFLLTPLYTYYAYRHRAWKRPRDSHLAPVFAEIHAEKHKRNIPTMAGLIMLVTVAAVTLIFNLDRQQTWLPLAAIIGAGLVGLLDDIINIRSTKEGIRGLRTPIKFALITAVALAAAWFFCAKLGYNTFHIPYFGGVEVGWLLVPIFVLVVVSTTAAVNISDGLDGLAGGLLSIAYATFGVIALLQGDFGVGGFCFTIVGALLAYVWFNIYPARFFMGNVGSFALGTGLGVVAMLTDTLFLLPIVGFVFVLEAGSSIIQIFSKKLFGRKVFRSAPVHYHLEAIGWPEVKVTMRFWVIAQVCAAIGLILAISGGNVR